MPMSIRLSEEATETLDDWVEEDRFESKSEAVRAALNLLARVQRVKDEGGTVLELGPEDLDHLREEAGVVVGRELA